MSDILKNRELLLGAAFFAFALQFVPYFLNIQVLTDASTKLTLIAAIANSFTLSLAVHSQFMRGVSFVRRKVLGYVFKVYMILAMVLMVVFAIYSQTSGPYTWVMYAIVNPLSSVNYGILAFYMASTCARAFRARNMKALLFLASGFIVLFYQAPLTGAYIPGIEPVALYITDTFVMAISRTFTISLTLGAIVFGVRLLLGKERSVIGGGE